MGTVFVIGVGMTPFGKFLKRSVKDLAAEALATALKDAGLEGEELEAAYVSNSFWGMFSGQHSIRGQVMLHPLGIKEIPIINTENACAGASTALNLAYTAIKAGQHDLVLALGAEKISHTDKMLSLRSYASCRVENFQTDRGADTASRGAAPGDTGRFRSRRRTQYLHGYLRASCPLAYEPLWEHSAPASGDLRQESRAWFFKPLRPVPYEDERGRGASG